MLPSKTKDMMNEINETRRRGDCFKLLAACFYEPGRSLLIAEKVGEKLWLLLDGQAPDAARAGRDMQNGLQELDQEKMSVDHAALFVGPFELLAAPYGSVYVDKSRRVMGESTMIAGRYYQEADLSVTIKEPPDHIIIELEFMYYLCSKEASAAENGLEDDSRKFRDIQVRFFNDIMKPWIPHFCKAITGGTDNTFYIHLSECLGHFMSLCENVYSKNMALVE